MIMRPFGLGNGTPIKFADLWGIAKDETTGQDDWPTALVVRDADGFLFGRDDAEVGGFRWLHLGGKDDWANDDHLEEPVTVVIDADGNNAEAEGEVRAHAFRADNAEKRLQHVLDRERREREHHKAERRHLKAEIARLRDEREWTR